MNKTPSTLANWDLIIKPKRGLLDLRLKEIWSYRDLLIMFLRRDIVTIYKQTVLGPIWFIVQPLLAMSTYFVVFSKIANIPTDGIPAPLFYLAGIIIWNYFSEVFTQTSDTFKLNESIFGKVYFPRLIIPFSKVLSGLIKFIIQSTLFISAWLFFMYRGGGIHPQWQLVFLPLLLLLMAGMGLGFGIIFTSLTAKYRDLKFVVQFGVQLLMYATPIIYPFSVIPPDLQKIMWWNPMVHVVEAFKFSFIGSGNFDTLGLMYSGICTFILLFAGIVIFKRTEARFMDYV